jgi:hypothetical protein
VTDEHVVGLDDPAKREADLIDEASATHATDRTPGGTSSPRRWRWGKRDGSGSHLSPVVAPPTTSDRNAPRQTPPRSARRSAHWELGEGAPSLSALGSSVAAREAPLAASTLRGRALARDARRALFLSRGCGTAEWERSWADSGTACDSAGIYRLGTRGKTSRDLHRARRAERRTNRDPS